MVEFPKFSEDGRFYPQIYEPDPDKRDYGYYLRNCQSFYSSYLKDYTAVGFNGRERVRFLRSFARGAQYIENPKGEKVRRETRLLNAQGQRIIQEEEDTNTNVRDELFYGILSPADKIMNSLIGAVAKIDFEVSADPLDYATRHSVDLAKLKSWVYAQEKEKIHAAAGMAGIEYPKPDFVPEDTDDLESFDKEGGFAPDHVMFIEQVIKDSFNISGWTPVTKELFFRDLFEVGYACIKNDYDPADGKVKPSWVDIEFADIQKSRWPDFRDAQRAFHFYTMNITTLRQYFPDKDEVWFKNVASNYCGMLGNPASDSWGAYNHFSDKGECLYDAFKCCIGSFEWIDLNKSKEVVTQDKWGRKKYEGVPLTKEVSSEKNKVVRFEEDSIRHSAKWVVGTNDGLFDWGVAYEQTFAAGVDAELTYQWYQLIGRSYTEQLIPVYKNFHDLWDKYKRLLRNAQGKVIWVDIDVLASTAGEKDDPQSAAKKAFRRMLATDKIMIRRTNAMGTPTQNTPMGEMEGGMGTLFLEILKAFELNFSLIDFVSGLNPLTLGERPDPNAPVKTSELAVNASANTMRPAIDGWMRTTQKTAENLARWICVLVKTNKFSRDAYEEVIGKDGIKSLMDAIKGEAEYGFHLTARPNDTERQYILQNIEASRQPNKNGESEITPDDADKLINMVLSGTPSKTIQRFFKKARQRKSDEDMKNKKELMQYQGDENNKNAQLASELTNKNATEQHAREMELQSLKNQGLLQNTSVQEGARYNKETDIERLKNEGKSLSEDKKNQGKYVVENMKQAK